MITVYLGPDGTWCEDYQSLQMYLKWMSDDYQTLELTEDQYEYFVNTH